MTTTVQKWGNSLAVRIPKTVADRLSIDQGSELEMKVNESGINMKPKRKKPTLDELLDQITTENPHKELDVKAVGKELF